MKKFDIPVSYQSHFIKKIKEIRKTEDPKKKNFSPTHLDFGGLQLYLARHFGFCYGVENAIEISYKAIKENPGKKIYLLSQMIHNPHVNKDLQEKGIQFIQDTEGQTLISWDQIQAEDIVIIPAFGTTLEVKKIIESKGIQTEAYDTTCPFVEKVWKTSHKLGQDDFTVLIHGKHKHEETRATFSHARSSAPSLVLKDITEAQAVADFIHGRLAESDLMQKFKGRTSEGFNPTRDLQRVGVVNQTTMLASETHEISEFMKLTMQEKYGLENIKNHFADTRDTLCYATNDNQQATLALLGLVGVDFVLVVGGHNSSNTQHLVELCEQKFPTYFIESAADLLDEQLVMHYNIHTHEKQQKAMPWPKGKVPQVIVTSGASCPDSMVEQVISKLMSFRCVDADLDRVEEYMKN